MIVLTVEEDDVLIVRMLRMKSFQDARIALLEARMSSEMAGLLRRFGGKPYSVPAVREVQKVDTQQLTNFLRRMITGSLQVIIFQTGTGVTALIREAERLGQLPELLEALHDITIVCRGPKPEAVLKQHGICSTYTAAEPYTTNELLEVLAPIDITHQNVAVVHYGERNERLIQALQWRQAELVELSLYLWKMPVDTVPLQMLVCDIIAERVDVVVFTSQIQARHLMQIAEDLRLTEELIGALKTKTIVASVGPTCSEVLNSYGVLPHVTPAHPKMGHLVKALVEYLN
jgi:uroporphyrinogen-III synthase